MPKHTLPAILLPLLIALGCAGNKNEGIVSGTVTVDGQPAETGALTYIPVDGKSSTAGAVIEDGKYTASVPVGTMKVQIHVPKVVGQRKLYDTPDSPMKAVMVESLPPRYNIETELVLDVKPGETTENYDLTTDP